MLMKILVYCCMLITSAVAQNIPKPDPVRQNQKTSHSSAPVTYPVAEMNQAKPAATAVNTFGLKMLAGMAAQHQHQNVFLSPLSIFTALVMTENGAAGQTRDGMRKTLAIPANLSEEDLHGSASA